MESTLSELVLGGAKLMVIGMSIVFLFLALLVWIIGVTSKLIKRYEGPEEPSGFTPPDDDRENDAELVAVITAAIHRHQTK
jgi:oxaloacetate decarboxylase gamma subunit